MPLITYKLSPTGGLIRPISMFIVNMTANQIGSNPAVVMIGNKIGADIRMTATGGRKKPEINKNILTAIINTHGFTSKVPIHSAIDCVIMNIHRVLDIV